MIRPLERADIAEIVALTKATHDEHRREMPAFFPQVFDEKTYATSLRARTMRHWFVLRPPTQTLVWDDGTGVKGVIDWDLTSSTCGGTAYFINNISVKSDARRRGIGRALLEAVRERARAAGCREIGAAVWNHNAVSAALFERAGFSPIVTHHCAKL
ncbi:MAG: GNAT family N-acetyltransferase [Pseudomonadota bacterium]